MTVGVYYYPWPEDFSLATPSRGNPLLKWKKAIWFKSNPRPVEYMKREFHERWPAGVFVNAGTNANWRKELGMAKEVVLLYPDAIGLGYMPLERAVKSKSGCEVTVLNGRKRLFPFSGEARRALYWRRFLQYSMAPEILITVIFVILSPVFWVADLFRVKRFS